MASKAKDIILKLTSFMVVMALVLGTMPFNASAAPWDREEDNDWSYAYYLGQEYLGNAGGAAVKPDPVGYGFQGVITDLTFVDDTGKTWTFVWSSEANGEWRITGRNVTESEAKAWPQVTDGGRYVGYCNGTAYVFTLSADGSAKDWTYARNNHANWFYYIRFIRTYTVNVFYQNETGTVEYNGVTYAAQDPLIREFYFLYPNGNIIDDSEYEDGEYTDPITLMPADYLSQDMKDQGYEIKYATDAQGRDVLQTGVTISLLGTNVLNVYCTLIPPKTENYTVLHTYYTNGEFDGQQSGGTLEVVEGADFGEVVDGIEKLPAYAENTYEYIRYRVDPESKTIVLVYVRTVAPVDLTVTKAWANDTPSLRPDSILVQLYRDGVAYGEPVELNNANGWTQSWTGLDGEYTWTVDEVAVPEGYEKSVSVENSVVVITNTHTNIYIGDAQVSATKVWADNGYPDRPASVTVQLLCNGEAYGEPVVLSADNNWHHTWTGLNEDLNWTVSEIDVPEGYTSTVAQDGFYFTVTNAMDYEPPAPPAPVDLTVTKEWLNDTPSLRPDSILVQLYRDGVAYGEPVELNDSNGWTNAWTGLDGEYTWTVDEVAVPEGYEKSVSVENGVVVITNTHTNIYIGDAQVSASKVWDDNGYPDRPASVTVQLLCNGETYGEPVILSADNNWRHTWTGLNEDLNWSVSEINVPEGYTATVTQNGFDFIITNAMDYEPPAPPVPVDLTVTKEWLNDTPSLRPDSILVQLYRNGAAYGEPVELNNSNGWTKTWTGLDGEYAWAVDEVAVPEGYVKTVTVENGVVVITNTHTDIRIGDAHVSVTKIWDDNGYPDRPASVTVQLLCNGEAHGEPVVLNADNNWHYTWTGLNEDLNWTVSEIDVPEGYTSTVAQDGFYFTVTNAMDYEPPTEPTDPPTEPTDPPTEPTDPPTEPTDPPTEPTDPPTEPTDPPTEPTEPEPTEPEPTENPEVVNVPVTGSMLSAWIMVSVISGIGLTGTLMARKKED